MDHTLSNPDLLRRRFLTSAASGLGAAAVGSLLRDEGLLAAESETGDYALAPKAPDFPARAKHCIFIYLAGGTSQVELFDHKPKLSTLTGKPLPKSFFENQRFSFINADQALAMGTRFKYHRYGQSGLEMSELLPHIGKQADEIALIRSMHTDTFDHSPSEILFSTGDDAPGRPSMGAWVTYGLGSEARNLPAYVVLMTGRGPVARSMNWGSGFLPTMHAGVVFRGQGEPVLNLANPGGVTRQMQRSQLDAIRALNKRRLETLGDPDIAARIASYELAFRMQSAAPELIDLASEDRTTHDAYGTDRVGESGSFARNCLTARRLVERGVRFVSIFHRRWDHHSSLHNRLQTNCRVVDQPIGALLADLRQRGLLDDTLVVWGTEFGRTPVTQNSAPDVKSGRDHHRYAFTTWMAGGGVQGGQAIGTTDEIGWHAVEDRVHVNDFHATLLHILGLDHLSLTRNFKGLEVRLTNQGGKVVEKLFG